VFHRIFFFGIFRILDGVLRFLSDILGAFGEVLSVLVLCFLRFCATNLLIATRLGQRLN
jgi:hypothetical protein